MRTSASHANAAGSHIADTAPATTPNANVQVQCKKTCTCTKSFKANYTHCAEITSALCAADGPKGVSDQYAHEGKLICLASGQANAEVLENCCSTLTCLKEVPIVAHYACKISDTLSVGANQTTGTPTEVVAEVTYGIPGNWIGRKPENGGNATEPMHNLAPCLTKTDQHGVAHPVNIYGGNKRADRPEGGFYVRMDEETSKTLDAATGLNPTCSQGGTPVLAPSLTASNDPSRSPQSSEVTQQVAAVHAASMAVRRLTPVECERLQGFLDGYTNITWRKKPEAPDGPRYKALGNSMATPVMRWIGERIARVEAGLSAAPAKS